MDILFCCLNVKEIVVCYRVVWEIKVIGVGFKWFYFSYCCC